MRELKILIPLLCKAYDELGDQMDAQGAAYIDDEAAALEAIKAEILKDHGISCDY